MKVYLVSSAFGLLVGLIYALLQVRSPPASALNGLLGMLIGEQAVPIAKKMLSKEPITASWLKSDCVAKITGVQAIPKTEPTAEDTTSISRST